MFTKFAESELHYSPPVCGASGCVINRTVSLCYWCVFAFVMLDLLYSVLCQEIVSEEPLRNDLFYIK